MQWFIYALGGGLGHLTRGIALARAAHRKGVTCTVLTNSPFANVVLASSELSPEDRLVVIPSDCDRDEVTHHVASEIEAAQFDVLIVDTFPRGLAGELVDVLPQLDVPKVLVHRDLNPQYVERFHLADFVQHYDAILLPGERGPLADVRPSHFTDRWLIRDSDEMLPRDAARRVFLGDGVDDRPIVLVSGSGRSEEVDEMRTLANHLNETLTNEAHIRFCSPTAPDDSEPKWPLLRLMGGIDVVIGAGGYNTVSECQATGTPLLAFPRSRMYDRQQLRLDDGQIVTSREQLMTRLRAALNHCSSRTAVPSFRNGTHQAVEFLKRLKD